MTKVLAVCNLKGGTGKTTLAVNLACAYAVRRRVVLLDADRQAGASGWTANGESPVRARPMPLEARVGTESEADARRAQWVTQVLNLRRSAELTVIDLPPQFEESVAGALAIANLLVIPVTPGGAELAATRRAKTLLERARAARPERPLDCVLVPNRVDRRTAIGRALSHTLSEMGETVGPTVRQRSQQSEAYIAGTWIGGHAPDSEAHKDIMALMKFLTERLF